MGFRSSTKLLPQKMDGAKEKARVRLKKPLTSMLSAGLLLFTIFGVLALGLSLTGCSTTLQKYGTPPAGIYQQTVHLPNSGDRRDYSIHVPPGYCPSSPLPLVIVLHGAFMDGKQMAALTGFGALADREGFLVVYPEGKGLFGYLKHWNAGFCCGMAMARDWADVEFLEYLIEHVSNRFSVEGRRAFLVGTSNGGMMAYAFAARNPHMVAGIAVVAGTAGASTKQAQMVTIPKPNYAVPIIAIHGKADPTIPYQGGLSSRHRDYDFLSTAQSVAIWREVNGCAPVAFSRTLHEGLVLEERWNGGQSCQEVVLYSIKDWGHSWPGDRTPSAENLAGYDAAHVIWDFFKSLRLGANR